MAGRSSSTLILKKPRIPRLRDYHVAGTESIKSTDVLQLFVYSRRVVRKQTWLAT